MWDLVPVWARVLMGLLLWAGFIALVLAFMASRSKKPLIPFRPPMFPNEPRKLPPWFVCRDWDGLS